jgi:glutathione S-transferase
MPRLMQPLDEIFARREFIAGDQFTVSDVAVGSMLAYIPLLLKLDLSEYPNVVSYMKRLAERPAFAKALPSAHAIVTGGRK